MTALVCETVTAPTMADLRQRRDAVRDADLVELRLDGVADPDVAGALAGRSRPVIVTCRPTWEGGQFAGPEDARRRLLGEALALGAEYVDIEWAARFDDVLATTGGRRVVLSSHDFDGLPDDLAGRVQAMRGTGAEVIKVAVTPHRLSDCIALAEVGRLGAAAEAAVLVAMGPRGIISRILPGRFASRWTYAGGIGAVGQLDVQTLIGTYRFRSLGERTALYGLAGSPVAHSALPALHNAAFQAAGIDAVSLPFDAADADDFLTFARAFGVDGASIAAPLNVPVFERVSDSSEAARTRGAVDTIRWRNGGWTGTNTETALGPADLDGLDRLVAQAEAQFEYWTGARPAPGVMRAVAEHRQTGLVADENHVV